MGKVDRRIKTANGQAGQTDEKREYARQTRQTDRKEGRKTRNATKTEKRANNQTDTNTDEYKAWVPTSVAVALWPRAGNIYPVHGRKPVFFSFDPTIKNTTRMIPSPR